MQAAAAAPVLFWVLGITESKPTRTVFFSVCVCVCALLWFLTLPDNWSLCISKDLHRGGILFCVIIKDTYGLCEWVLQRGRAEFKKNPVYVTRWLHTAKRGPPCPSVLCTVSPGSSWTDLRAAQLQTAPSPPSVASLLARNLHRHADGDSCQREGEIERENIWYLLSDVAAWIWPLHYFMYFYIVTPGWPQQTLINRLKKLCL